MIVRDLPDIELVRAGIRHHHERWDGDGYLDRLAGEDIPLIARILAVGDAFSAMTTTRPYRKALDVREALRRLEDAAGTQLDERLVVAFVDGIETDADAPLPGDDAGGRLWLPGARRVIRRRGRAGRCRVRAAGLRGRPGRRRACAASPALRARAGHPRDQHPARPAARRVLSSMTGSCTSIARACWRTTSTPTAITWRRSSSRATTHGDLDLNHDGVFSYEPDHGFTGIDTFTYPAHDGTIGVARLVTFTVTNVAPIGRDDHYPTKEDVKLEVDRPGVLKNDDDADGDKLKAKLVTGPDHGKLTCTTRASSSTSPPTGSRARTRSPIGPSTAPTSRR